MADGRFNPHPGFGAGRGMPAGIPNPGMVGMPGYHPYNQQMVMVPPNMRFPAHAVRMGPPNTPPPPYSAHIPNPGMTNRPRLTLDKTKGNQQLTDKERAFQEQRQKLRMFGKPGMTKVDPNALIGSLFATDTKKKAQENKKPTFIEESKDEDDGFGDFLQGPSVQSDSVSSAEEKPSDTNYFEPELELDQGLVQQTEKKDLDSMMMEFSDLNAPKKAKGFHKPTLNEVQKHSHHQKSRSSSYHDSDHARSWKRQCDDLTGLFQLPEKSVVPIPAVVSGEPGVSVVPLTAEQAQMHISQQTQIQLQQQAQMQQVPHQQAQIQQVPHQQAQIQQVPHHQAQMQQVPHQAQMQQVPQHQAQMHQVPQHQVQMQPVPQPAAGSGLPNWYYFKEDQLPPVYKQVWEASLVNEQISTERLYPILLMSGLPREKLAQIWSLSNTVTPGQLAKQELWAVLALIALTQNNVNTISLEILSRCPEPPVPIFAAGQGVTAPEPAQPNPLSATPEEDDFADFQAASVPAQQQPPNKSHTSPSFEEDYYTDGRDSLSQISTSEQSENEDIRNFENYVEEFNNQKKQAPSGSPLHCPFPSIQAPHATLDMATPQDISPVPLNLGENKANIPAVTSGLSIQRNNNNLSFNMSQVSFPPPLNTSLPTSKKPHGTTQPDLSTAEEDSDFSDFKSAVENPNSTNSNANDVSLIKEEDKYDALRAFSLQDDIEIQPSAFEKVPKIGHGAEDNLPVKTEVDEDWADFATAPASQEVSAPAENTQAPAEPSSAPPKTSKEDILTLFNKTDTIGSLFNSGSPNCATDLSNEIGTGETHATGDKLETMLFNSASSSDSLHTVKKPQFGYGFINPPTSDPVLSPSSSLGNGFVHNVSKAEQFTSVNDTSTSDSVTEDWGKYSSRSISTSNPLEGVHFPAMDSNKESDDWGDFSSMATPASADTIGEENWCNFNSEADDVVEREPDNNFVTIKKQNLGTNEILGLFKVRDDPTTLSSYQLPQQQLQPTNKMRKKSQPSLDDDDGFGPPPMDFENDEDEEDFSRGYDLDDMMQNQIPATTYSVYGHTVNRAIYTQSQATRKVKETQEESGSVHSLELRSASHLGDCSGSDSHSMSSVDGKSKSTDSLEQKGHPQEPSDGQSNKEESIQPPLTEHHPIKPQELLATMPDFGDKYNIENEAQGSDRYGYEWERCLLNCCQVITEANTLFNTVSSSSVCNEVLKSNQGSQYITSIVEVYRVVCRVMTSMRSTAISTTELEQTLKNIDLAWNNLTAFLVGVSLLPDSSTLIFDNCVLKSDSEVSKNLACGLCLLSVDTSPAKSLIQPASSDCSKLTYAGRQYHSTCANFWVNCVDQTLPSLTLPELL